MSYGHDAPAASFAVAEPIAPFEPGRLRTAAEEARTIVAMGTTGTLATLSKDGTPWASMVAYGQLADGAPVLFVSTLAEHGRNLPANARASICVIEASEHDDPLDAGRVTIAGTCERPADPDEAMGAYRAAVPPSRHYEGFGDFSLWVLRVERVRWVGGYGRMDSTSAADYSAAEPDPVAASAAYATRHMNEDHADALLAMARTLAGFPDAESATCRRADRYGLDLWVRTPRGSGPARVTFAEPCVQPDGLRAAAVEITKRARAQSPAA